MLRHAGLQLHPSACCFSSPRCLFLLATIFAVANCALLKHSGKHHPFVSHTDSLLPTSRVTLVTVARCIPKGKQYIFGVTPDVQCPCLVRFSLARGMRREIRGRTVDFLIVSSEEAQNVREQPRRNVSYIERYSIPATRATFDDTTSEYRYLSPGFEISESGAFALVLRTTSPKEECGLSVGYVLEPVPVQCPVRLKSQGNAPMDFPSTNGETVLAPRVVGGAPPTDRHRASMVSFVRKEGLYCSGSYISPGWVLTAAHCRVAVGDTAFVGGHTGITGLPVKVTKVVPHSSYDFSKSNGPHDIAIVQLEGDSVAGAVPLPINIRAALPAEMSYVRIAGYGRISEGFAATDPPSLRTVDLPIVPMEQCKQEYSAATNGRTNLLNSDVQICAGYIDGECDACQGDSGGPVLVLDETGGPVLVGIVSYGMGCARSGIPGVYTRIAPFAKWIRSVATNAQLSSTGTVVIARSLNSNVNASAPTSGIGVDGLNLYDLDTSGVSEIMGETRIVTLLKIIVPSVIACVSGVFFLVACVMCFAASRYRDQTVSDYATGKRTKSLGGDSSDRPGAGSSLEDSIFGALAPRSCPKPARLVPPPKVWSPPANPPPPRERMRLGRRKKKQEIVRMPEDMLRMEIEEAGVVVDGATRLADQPREVHEAREGKDAALPRRRSKRDSGRGQSANPTDQQGAVYEARKDYSHELRPDVSLPRRISKRDSGRRQPVGILRNVESEEIEARVEGAQLREEIQEIERRRRNNFFEERYPAIQNPASNFLMPTFDEIEPERTSTRPIVRFQDDLHK